MHSVALGYSSSNRLAALEYDSKTKGLSLLSFLGKCLIERVELVARITRVLELTLLLIT
jgi:hypothetical protein